MLSGPTKAQGGVSIGGMNVRWLLSKFTAATTHVNTVLTYNTSYHVNCRATKCLIVAVVDYECISLV